MKEVKMNNMITEDYISFEVAKLLKKKGFNISLDSKNWMCCMYDENGNIHWGIYDKNWYFRITYQMTMKWLRKIYRIDIVIEVSDPSANDRKYYCVIWKTYDSYILDLFSSYEEACESAIKYCLENLI